MHSASLFILLGIFLVAVYSGNDGIALISAMAFSGSLFARCWARLSVLRIDSEFSLSERRAFPNDVVELSVKVTNNKPLPMPWMETAVKVPLALLPNEGDKKGTGEGGQSLCHSTSLLWYTTVTHSFRLHCTKRGYYRIGPMEVTSGDPFGLYSRTVSMPTTENIIVYPTFLPMETVDIPSLAPMGESVTRYRVFEDPGRLLGVRDYMPQDGFRRVHWKATARRQRLQSKIFESTTSLRTALFVDVHDFAARKAEEEFETALSACATVASRVLDASGQVGLYLNTCKADSGQAVSVQPAGNRGQLPFILENLAKVTMMPSGRFLPFLQREMQALRWGTTLVVIAHGLTEEHRLRLTGLKTSGYRVIALLTGWEEGDNGSPESIPCVRLGVVTH